MTSLTDMKLTQAKCNLVKRQNTTETSILLKIRTLVNSVFSKYVKRMQFLLIMNVNNPLKSHDLRCGMCLVSLKHINHSKSKISSEG